MASTTKHLRSSTASKRPTASGLAEGQLAINTASGTPGLFLKDNAGTIVKVGPAHVGASAPNATPAGSAGNSTGELWINNSTTIHGLNYYNGSAFANLTPSGTVTVAGLVELATDAETQTGTDTVRAVTPSGLQSKVSNSISTTSSTTIASSTAVKTAYDLANAALPKAGGIVTGALEIGTSGSLVFEGSSDDTFETTLAVVNPTADRTITFPNITGTVITTGDSGTVTSAMITDLTIVNGDISASAAIGLSKLATGALPSGITVASANIVDGTIVDADVNASAAIVDTKLATISTAGKVSGTAITSGNINTSGELSITNTVPAVRLTETGGTATHSQTLLVRDSDTFQLQTRNSAGVFLSTDYSINADASGATAHRWFLANAERARITASGLGVGTASPDYRLEVARLGSDLAITGVDVNTAILATAGGGTSSSGAAITLAGGTASLCGVFFGDTADGDIGGVLYDHSTDTLSLRVNAAERMRIDSTGRMGFNSTALGGVSGAYRFAGSITGAVSSQGIVYTPTIQADATAAAVVFSAGPSTASNGGTPYTLAEIRYFFASPGTFSADSSITTQRGFTAASALTGATNNYGFYGDIGSATGRWNFFANGTAPNYFNGDLRTNRVVTTRSAPANSNISATATASSLLDGLRTGTPTGNITLTLPTGTDMDAAFQDLQANQSFEWSVINLAAATHLITVTAAAGHTVVGNMAVAAATSGRFITRKTAANTFISYRIA